MPQSIPPPHLKRVVGNSLDGDKLAVLFGAIRAHGTGYASCQC